MRTVVVAIMVGVAVTMVTIVVVVVVVVVVVIVVVVIVVVAMPGGSFAESAMGANVMVICKVSPSAPLSCVWGEKRTMG